MRPPTRTRVDKGIRFFSSFRSPAVHGARPAASLHHSSSESDGHHSTREPVPLRPEQTSFCPQVLEGSIRVFVVTAKRMTVLNLLLITVLYYVFEFLLGLSMAFYNFSHLIHQATVIKNCFDRL